MQDEEYEVENIPAPVTCEYDTKWMFAQVSDSELQVLFLQLLAPVNVSFTFNFPGFMSA